MPVLNLENERKSTRIDLRMEPSRKKLYERAAAINGQTFTQWTLDRLDAAAERDVIESRTLSLSDAAFEQFCEILDEPVPAEMQELLGREAIWAR